MALFLKTTLLKDSCLDGVHKVAGHSMLHSKSI